MLAVQDVHWSCGTTRAEVRHRAQSLDISIAPDDALPCLMDIDTLQARPQPPSLPLVLQQSLQCPHACMSKAGLAFSSHDEAEMHSLCSGGQLMQRARVQDLQVWHASAPQSCNPEAHALAGQLLHVHGLLLDRGACPSPA